MAARRLIIVMLVLLGISSAIAVIVPAPDDDPAPEEVATTATTGETGATGTTGKAGKTDEVGAGPRNAELVEAELQGKSGSEPVRAEPGDRLILTIDPGRDADVEIPGLGLAGTATEYAPVVFDIRLPAGRGNYPVVETNDRELGRIAIAEDRNRRG